MKHINYSFNDSDIKTCLFALTLLPIVHDDDDEITDIQISINEQCAHSLAKKLSAGNVENITPNEIRILCCCIIYGCLICDKEVPVDADTYKECMEYIFSLKKLDNSLCSQLDM